MAAVTSVRPMYKVVSTNNAAGQLTKQDVTLAGQADLLFVQSQAMFKLMSQLETLQHCGRKWTSVQLYGKVIRQTRLANKAPVGRK